MGLYYLNETAVGNYKQTNEDDVHKSNTRKGGKKGQNRISNKMVKLIATRVILRLW